MPKTAPDAKVLPEGQKLPQSPPRNKYEYFLPYPPPLNHYYIHTGPVFLSNSAKKFKMATHQLLIAQKAQILTGRLAVQIDAYRPRKAGDIDGICKLALDCFQGYLYENDRIIEELHVYRYDDKKNPRLVVQIWNL